MIPESVLVFLNGIAVAAEVVMKKHGDAFPVNKEKKKIYFWQSEFLPEVLFMDGSFREMSFARHTHETYAFGVIERGALGFRYRGENVVATAGMLGLVVPGEVHDGHPALDQGWTYRMAYAEPEAIRRIAGDLYGRDRGFPFIAQGALESQELAGIFRMVYGGLRTKDTGRLAASTLWLHFISLLFERFGEYPVLCTPPRAAVREACSFLRENMHTNVSLDELAALSSLSPWHFLRTFRKETGLPPHAYLAQLRVRRSEHLLRAGFSPALAASEAGFADQSHLTRWFRRIVGTTPAAFMKDLSR